MLKKGLKGLLGQLDTRHWIEKDLDKVAEKSKRPVKAINYFYASWAGFCPKYIQENMNGLLPDTMTNQSRRIMDNGNYMHFRYAAYFKSIGKLIEEEPPFKKDFGDGVIISGRGDLIVLDDKDEKFLIELKSINNRNFKEVFNAPKLEHLCQWNLCSNALGINKGAVFYENKDDQTYRFHVLEYEESVYNKIFNDFKLIKECNDKGLLVDRPEVCINPKYCPLKNICKKEK